MCVVCFPRNTGTHHHAAASQQPPPGAPSSAPKTQPCHAVQRNATHLRIFCSPNPAGSATSGTSGSGGAVSSPSPLPCAPAPSAAEPAPPPLAVDPPPSPNTFRPCFFLRALGGELPALAPSSLPLPALAPRRARLACLVFELLLRLPLVAPCLRCFLRDPSDRPWPDADAAEDDDEDEDEDEDEDDDEDEEELEEEEELLLLPSLSFPSAVLVPPPAPLPGPESALVLLLLPGVSSATGAPSPTGFTGVPGATSATASTTGSSIPNPVFENRAQNINSPHSNKNSPRRLPMSRAPPPPSVVSKAVACSLRESETLLEAARETAGAGRMEDTVTYLETLHKALSGAWLVSSAPDLGLCLPVVCRLLAVG